MTQTDLFDAGKRDKSLSGPTCTPARVGSGPQGETCRTCKHATKIKYANSFYKCGLVRFAWTHGTRTDIKLRWAACIKWEAKETK